MFILLSTYTVHNNDISSSLASGHSVFDAVLVHSVILVNMIKEFTFRWASDIQCNVMVRFCTIYLKSHPIA